MNTQQLKIAIVAPPWLEIPPVGHGGVELMCGNLIAGLTQRGHDATLIGTGRNKTAAKFYATADQPQLDQIAKIGTTRPELTHLASAHHFLADNEFDIIHDHTISGPLFAPLRTAPTVTTTHIRTEELSGMYAALGHHTKLVAISRRQRDLNPDLNWAGVVYNSVDVKEFEFSDTPGDYAVAIGRFHPEKGLHNAIEICREAEIPLVLVGRLLKPEEKKYFEETIKPLLHKGVEVVLNASRPQVIEILQKAQCLIHAVEWEEPFGLVLIEAMSCGTPVLGLRRGAIPEIVVEGTGWVRDKPGELADLVGEAKRLDRAACREHANTTFSIETMAEQYEDIYRSVLSAA